MSDREYMDSTSKALSIEKDSQINVVVNRSGEADSAIDLIHVFHNMKIKKRVYAWVVILCMVVGLCAPLLLYQFKVGTTRVSSVVTLNYYLQDGRQVQRLQAPDGKDLDLAQVTSAYVLQSALEKTALSDKVDISGLRSSIHIDRILTEDSRRQQEVAAKRLQRRRVHHDLTLQVICHAWRSNRFL